MPPFFSNGPANQRRAGPSCDKPPTNLKVMVGVKQATETTGEQRAAGPGRGLWLDEGERAPTGGSAKARAGAKGERAPPDGSAEARAAATWGLDDGERAPPGGSAEAMAAATGVIDDGERAPPGGSAEARSWRCN